MPIIERITPRGVNKELSARALDQGGNRRVVNPLIDAQNARYLSSEVDDDGEYQNIPGTILYDIGLLPAGTNTTIGTFSDATNNIVIFFNHNSNGDHGVYQFNPTNKSFVAILVSDVLNFSLLVKYRITGVGIVNNLLYWTDNLNPQRVLNISRSYTTVTSEQISLFKKAPTFRPEIGTLNRSHALDTVIVNYIRRNNYQFATQYVFLDNETSALSDFSYVSMASSDGDENTTDKSNVEVLHYYDEELVDVIKELRCLFRKSDTDTWKIYKNVSPSETPLSGGYVTANLYDNVSYDEIDDVTAAKYFDTIPNVSKSLAFFKNRIFLTSDKEGYNTAPNGDVETTVTNTIINEAFANLDDWTQVGTGLSWAIVSGKAAVDLPGLGATSKTLYKTANNIPPSTTINFTLDITRTGAVYLVWMNGSTEVSRTSIVPTGLAQTFSLTSPPGIYTSVGFAAVSGSIPSSVTLDNLIAAYDSIVISEGSGLLNGMITPSVVEEAFSSGGYINTLYMKDGGSYSLGIEYFDTPKRSMGVFSKVNITASLKTGSSVTGTPPSANIDLFHRQRLNIVINGDAPEWAKYYRIVRTKEHTYEAYMQIPAKVLFYVSEKGTNLVDSTQIEFSNGKIYLKSRPSLASLYSQVHFQVPDAIPFTPDTDYFVRIISPSGATRATQVLSFDGQMIATDNFGLADWNAVTSVVLIEVFKYKTTREKFYYGASKTYVVNNDLSHSVTDIDVEMDTVVNEFNTAGDLRFKFTNLSKGTVSIGNTYDPSVNSAICYVEAPTSSLIRSITDGLVTKPIPNGMSSDGAALLDYSKPILNLGRSSLLASNPRELVRNTTIRYSDSFIQDSNINGLSSFSALNEYALPQNRTPIVKLQPADNILLAIHERSVTSLYIGKGFLKESNGNNLLTKTDDVIGNDNEMDGGYGSYHPQSVAEINGNVFAFDIFKGTPWRYTNAGVKPINFGMDAYFKSLADQYLPYRDEVSILGTIDPFNKEYILTFPAYEVVDVISLPGVTWAFNYSKDEWTHRYSFKPEAYAHINNTLIGFHQGKLWIHNVDFDNYNTFYGVKYERQLRFLVNPAPTKVKNFIALQVSADVMADEETPSTIVFRAFNKEGQETYMRLSEFEKLEGIYYAPVLKNIYSAVESGLMPLRDGDDMRSQVLEILFTYDGSDAGKWRYANIVFVMSEYSH